MSSYKCCSSGAKENSQIIKLANLLKIVAESSRIQLLCILQRQPHCVSEIMEHGDFSQSLVSHHLRDLRQIDVVKTEKKGQRVYYSLTSKGQKITQALFQLTKEN